ncbi:endonuclease domain-containing protein [Streptomyces olivaceus]
MLYASLSPRTRADAYLRSLCEKPRRAYYWDHCHEPGHGRVRGPLCASCNTLEGGGWSYVDVPGAAAHLLRCSDCRRTRTIPSRHRARLVQARLDDSVHEPCGIPSWQRSAQPQPDGAVHLNLFCYACPAEGRVPSPWTYAVEAAEVDRLVAEFLNDASAVED